MKKEKIKGITLIALVITIIVLLILAGITLGLVLGDNGIMNRAKESKLKTEQAQIREQDSLEALLGELNSMTGEIEKVKDENPGVLEVDHTNPKILSINSVEDLVAFSKEVNNGNTYEGYTIKLGQSLDIQSELSYVDSNTVVFGDVNKDSIQEGLMIELGKGEGFTPIGIDESKCFKGNFNGQNNTIYHLFLSAKEKQNVGLFGYLEGEVKQLKLEKGKVTGDNTTVDLYMGAFCGLNMGTLDRCYNRDTIVTTKNGKQYVRGGGIVGRSYGNVTNCYNNAKITSDGNASDSVQLAGIVTENRNMGKISNCINEGYIRAEATTGNNIYAGGICAYSESYCEKSYNKGKIECLGSAPLTCGAGVIASNGAGTGVMKNCYNIGEVQIMGVDNILRAGGTCGNLSGQIINCYNLGSVSVNTEGTGDYIQVGGIATNSTNTSSIINCFNKGNIKVTGERDQVYLAGICAYFSGKLVNSYNQGNLVASNVNAKVSIQIGGLISSTNLEGSVDNCYTTGEIQETNVTTRTRYVGQLTGVNASNKITKSYYLQGAYPGAGAGTPYEASMTKEQMTASTFLQTLNNNLNNTETQEPLSKWKQNPNEYPIFEWE